MSPSIMRSSFIRSPIHLAAILAGAAVLAIAPPFLNSYWVGLLTEVLIFAVLAMSLDILLGYTGLPSLGHAGIFGVAAYAVAVLSAVSRRLRDLCDRCAGDRHSADRAPG